MKKKNFTKISDGSITAGFDTEMLDILVEQIIPTKSLVVEFHKSSKYQQILSSIREIGIIEPPVIVADGKSPTHYILLDGHLRIEALKSLGITEVTCLVSSDDEAFTYNKYINRISVIQEHRMIVRAVERGVSQEKIANALNVDVKNIISKCNLLVGICQEAIDMLKDKIVSNKLFSILRKMKPYRQIDAVTLMNDAGIYTITYLSAILAATPKDQLANPEKPKSVKGLNEEQMARMESEMSNLQREYSLIEDNYGTDVLNLTLAKGYLVSLLGNARVVRYLLQYHSEMLKEFQKITEITSLISLSAASESPA